mmetsp:Transcript_16260/g.50478  ORF Transcript_16260/g.50478 Transcript_16260/m.50478 type:complete len:273 (+) Transcript_16260:479-1297(+)
MVDTPLVPKRGLPLSRSSSSAGNVASASTDAHASTLLPPMIRVLRQLNSPAPPRSCAAGATAAMALPDSCRRSRRGARPTAAATCAQSLSWLSSRLSRRSAPSEGAASAVSLAPGEASEVMPLALKCSSSSAGAAAATRTASAQPSAQSLRLSTVSLPKGPSAASSSGPSLVRLRCSAVSLGSSAASAAASAQLPKRLPDTSTSWSRGASDATSPCAPAERTGAPSRKTRSSCSSLACSARRLEAPTSSTPTSAPETVCTLPAPASSSSSGA